MLLLLLLLLLQFTNQKVMPHDNCLELFCLRVIASTDPENASVITTMQGKSKKKLAYDIKIREALEIRRHNCGPGKGLNEDMGSYVKTDIWDPVLRTIDN